jgi:excisionase family DNA binding protein
MKTLLSPNDRMLKVLQAPPEMQAQIDAILEGRAPSAGTDPNSGPLLMNMSSGAAYLGTSRATLWRLIRSGKIIPVEIRPGTFRVRRHDIERFAGVRS